MKTSNAYEEGEISEINMTPFVDIVLVILVIFMATATFVAQGKIAISLPKSSVSADTKEPLKPLVISIDKEGLLYLDDKLIDREALESQLLKNSDAQTKGVILRSDAKTEFERVVTVIDICKQNSISKFSIQTQTEKK